MNFLSNKSFIYFLIKFLFIFSLLYFGTLAIIGLAAPGSYYSPFVQQHLDYISWMRSFLLDGSKYLLSIFNIDTYRTLDFRLRIPNGRGVILAYDCVGYGVMSFWVAFVVASTTSLIKKVLWVAIGLILIYLINISRVSLLLVAINRKWDMPLGIDHHTWFTIVAYITIFILIYFFEKKNKTDIQEKPVEQPPILKEK